MVCRAVREAGFKVALSGLGGDEATGGYSHFRYLRYLKGLSAMNRSAAAQAIVGMATRGAGRRLSAKAQVLLGPEGPRDAWDLSLLQRQVWPQDLTARALGLDPDTDLVQDVPVGLGRSHASALTTAEYRLYLQCTLLPDADAYSMASSVELRVPMVDRFFLGAAVGAGGTHGLGKVGFAQAVSDQRLRELASLPKQGFSLPVDAWMRHGLLRPHVQLLAQPDAPVWQHIDPVVGRRVVDDWQQGRSRWSHAWSLVVLDQWLRSLA